MLDIVSRVLSHKRLQIVLGRSDPRDHYVIQSLSRHLDSGYIGCDLVFRENADPVNAGFPELQVFILGPGSSITYDLKEWLVSDVRASNWITRDLSKLSMRAVIISGTNVIIVVDAFEEIVEFFVNQLGRHGLYRHVQRARGELFVDGVRHLE